VAAPADAAASALATGGDAGRGAEGCGVEQPEAKIQRPDTTHETIVCVGAVIRHLLAKFI
jgi:hypothetical protein